MSFKITTGAIERPQRVVVYGPEGIGKTTFASMMPNPVFVDVEDGSSHIECMRLQQPRTWPELLQQLEWLTREPHGASTLVVDTIDAAELLCQEHVRQSKGWKSIEEPGYGKGYVVVREEFKRLLDDCDRAVAAGLNVCLVAHAAVRKFEQPGETAYDKFELKLNKHLCALVKEWCDALLFIGYKVRVAKTDEGKGRATGGKPTVFTCHDLVWDAKNRWNLPPELDARSAEGLAAVMEHLPERTAAAGEDQWYAPEQPTAADPGGKSASEMDANELRAEQARRAMLPAYYKPLLDLMAGVCTIDELEACMVWKGKREQGQPLENWGKAFVDWLVSQWPGVEKALGEMREIKKVAAATDVPF